MIFVISGWFFDDLLEEMDRIAPKLKEHVIAQIGNSKYIPKNMKWFRFHDSFYTYYKKSDVVISHYGAGTIFEVLRLGKKLICIENPEMIRNPDIVDELSRLGYLMKCKNVRDLEACIKKSKNFKFKKYESPECKIPEKIDEFVKNSGI
ncbi:MAG: hypothetical protein HYW24_01795 [Candidatus Aenigmarchaeota archaeon]|nr:hypothetical protein [Candidatus Aenigmarchaeota archaeon]